MKVSTKASLSRALRYLQSYNVSKTQRLREAIRRKQELVNEVKGLLKKFRSVAIISLENVPSHQYNLIKGEIRKYGIVKVYKNNVFFRAAKELGIEGIEELSKHLTGINAFLFTNSNPYEIALIIEKIVAPRYAKPGDKAESDIYVPEGPTGIPPGPMLSVFGKLKIRTQVREGIIWIAKETKVAKASDEISPELSSLLRKLDIKPIMVRLSLKAVWEEGKVYSSDDLKIDIDTFKNEVLKAVSISKELAIETAMPLPDILPQILARAHRRALLLASEAGFITPETAAEVIRTAVAKALTLAIEVKQKVPDIGIEVEVHAYQPPSKVEHKKEEKEEEEEEKKEVSEEEIAEGISSLFG